MYELDCKRILHCVAAEAEGIIYIMSTRADCTMEEVTKAGPNGVKWLQLYIYKDRY